MKVTTGLAQLIQATITSNCPVRAFSLLHSFNAVHLHHQILRPPTQLAFLSESPVPGPKQSPECPIC